MNVTGMSREELEQEARRIGVIAPERLGRHALERRIREHHASPIRRARRAFRGLVDLAKAIAGAPPSLPRASEKPTASEATTRTPTAAPTPAAAPSTEPLTKKPVSTAAPTPTPAATPPSTAAARPEPLAKEPSPAAATRTSADSDLPGEPIPTRTMARLLADQGHGRRALAIYKKLLRDNPGDTDLREEVDRLESSARGRSTKATRRSNDAEDDESEGVEVVALPVGRSRVLVAWSVSGPALAAAESLLDDPGALEARVIVVRADADGAIRREVRERPAEPAGEWVVPVYAGARVTAAVGLKRGGRFVSVAHAPVVIA